MPGDSRSGSSPPWRSTLRKRAGAVVVVGVAALGIWALKGHDSEISASIALIEHAQAWPLILAVLAEAGSVAAFGIFTWRLLGVGLNYPPLLKTLAVATANTTINNTVPGGTAFASVYTYREFRGMGADPVFSSWVVLAVNLLAAVALGLLAVVGVALSFHASQGLDLLLSVPVLSAVLMGMAALFSSPRLFSRLLRPPLELFARLANRFRREPLQVEEAIARIGSIATTKTQVLVAIGWAVANWVMDATVLALAYVAIGSKVPWGGILLAYGAGQLAANLPVTPGGLGVVEGSLSIALVAYGGAQEPAVAAVLLYRLISFWLVVPFGWLSYFATNLVRRRAGRTRIASADSIEGGGSL
ncbi:MAG: lysylphosphatidylglycerol synthase transmembrane domain-containing protein [Actinomycetota bacterium]|nr:lysylphosphatidylglycerol synthase transmembrane domain-containing protein [Actinomycetota bacterium]